MAARWLISIDANGLRVAPSFVERLQKGEARALRQLAETDLTALYRRKYTKLTRRQQEGGLFWTEELPPFVLIPFVRGGPHPASAWVEDYEVLTDTPKTRREWRRSLAFAKAVRAGLAPNEGLSVKMQRNKVVAKQLKPNPKFELVVVNKHDRAALLKLLGEVDPASNVRRWLAERTEQTGATRSMVLYGDYADWCERTGNAPAGKKSFAQALVADGVVKLPRSGAGERYQLTLRPLASR